MTIQEAIQKAVEGGYQYKYGVPMTLINDAPADKPSRMRSELNMQPLVLDPMFWQSLGKSMGWGRVCGALHECYLHCEYQGADKGEWLYHWHRLIDHLASGKSIEEYFENL